MSAKLTSQTILTRRLQWKKETTENTFADDSGAFACPGVVKKFSIKTDRGYREVAELGPEDLYAIMKGKRVYEISFTFEMNDALEDFLDYCFNAQNQASPTGTPSESLSMMFGFVLDTTEMFVKMKGGHVVTTSVSGGIDRPWEFTTQWIFHEIAEPSASGLATATYASAPSGDTWDWLSGGTTPVSVGGSAINVVEFNATSNRNTEAEYTMGNEKFYSALLHGRRMGGTFKVHWTAVTLSGVYETAASAGVTVAAILKTAVSTLTFTGCKLTSLGHDADSGAKESKKQDFGFTAKGFTDL